MDKGYGAVALKEWGVTCRALAEGSQIVLLRKGGLRDAEGIFSLEQQRFWLLPTGEHQSRQLVKPEYRDLFDRSTFSRRHAPLTLDLWAEAKGVWEIVQENDAVLSALPHIWSEDYLATRWNYQPEAPLLVVAVWVQQRSHPHVTPWQDSYGGCRSWISLPPLATDSMQAVLEATRWAAEYQQVEECLQKAGARRVG